MQPSLLYVLLRLRVQLNISSLVESRSQKDHFDMQLSS